MKTRIFTLICALLLLCGYTNVYAQTEDSKIGIVLLGGYSNYAGDWGNDFFHFGTKSLDNNRSVGASINYFLSKNFDLCFMGTYGTVSFYKDDVRMFKDYVTQANVNLKYKFGIDDDATVKPFIFVGTGIINHDNNGNPEYAVNGFEWMPITGGAGVNFRLNDFVYLQYQMTYGYWGSDKHDFITAGDYNDAHLLNTLGVGFNIGAGRDEDKDGVSDKRDQCPGTPVEARVDKAGCPLDADKDGIADYLDKCPNEAGVPSAKGCPDADKDGVSDAEDQCPSEAGTLEFKGCPDTDGDGIIDKNDKCPTVKGVVAFEGCPDSDNDGIQDAQDSCPNSKGLKQYFGCPDTDGDGVHDGIDKCPTIAGTTTNNGCPEVKAEVTLLFQKALQGIQFETGKAVIKPVSYPILNSIVKVMNENPNYKLLIGGHTDDVGNDATNMTLSQNRADAVAKYMIGKGVSPMRVEATGYGETQPVDTNKTKAGRARNRRVELKVEFIETVKQ